jgi:hypothetical protein
MNMIMNDEYIRKDLEDHHGLSEGTTLAEQLAENVVTNIHRHKIPRLRQS